EDGIRQFHGTGVQACALPISDPFAFLFLRRSWRWLGVGGLCRRVVARGRGSTRLDLLGLLFGRHSQLGGSLCRLGVTAEREKQLDRKSDVEEKHLVRRRRRSR